MYYKGMDNIQAENAILASIEAALTALNNIDNTYVPPELLNKLESIVEDWEGWGEFVVQTDYERYLDAIDDIAMERYYEENNK